jgi:hypothetical protein
MQDSIEVACYSVLLGALFFLYRSYGKDSLLLVVRLIIVIPLYGCAAGQVMVASYEDGATNCIELESELGVSQIRIQKLETTDSSERDVRNFILGVGGFILPPLGVINAALFLTDSYAADYTEKKVLKNCYNDLVEISQNQGCGLKYALIPLEEENKEPNA